MVIFTNCLRSNACIHKYLNSYSRILNEIYPKYCWISWCCQTIPTPLDSRVLEGFKISLHMRHACTKYIINWFHLDIMVFFLPHVAFIFQTLYSKQDFYHISSFCIRFVYNVKENGIQATIWRENAKWSHQYHVSDLDVRVFINSVTAWNESMGR